MRGISILTVVTTCVSVCMGQGGLTDTRLGLLASQLGVAPVPGVQPQGRPGGNQNGNLQQFPPNSGGGIFTQPDNFNQGFGNSITGGIGGGGSGTCRCHPRNQNCPPSTSRKELTGIRIANNGASCTRDEKLCCPPGARDRPSLPIQQGPQPVGPIIPSRNQPNCGISTLTTDSNLQAGFGEYPWMTVITGLNNEYLGGGALISSNVVLTAAHKINGRDPRTLRIRVGDHNVATVQDHPTLRHVEVSVQRIVTHPQFMINNLHNDVALLFLSQPVNQNQPHIGSVCLPEQGQLFSPQRCWVSGWGENAFSSGNYQTILKKVDVPIWDPFVCEQRLRAHPRLGGNFNLDKTSFLCAGGEQGKDACTGDGGAPLVCRGSNGRFAVVGLVAWGLGCAEENIPGVYVNVANYVNFIKQHTGL